MAGSTRGAAVNGARGGAGNYLVEGVDNNDQGQGGRGQLGAGPGGAATTISPDAIGEYRVITNNFAAEYGKAGGFVTDTVLKSGTNQWHGSLFEYNRVQALAANGFFSNANDLKDSLVRNQIGGSIGGDNQRKGLLLLFDGVHRLRQANALSATGTTQQYLDWVKTGGLQQCAVDPVTVFCADLAALDRVLRERVFERLDHRNLVLDVPDFAEGREIPTSENVAWWIAREVQAGLGADTRVLRVRLAEEPGLWAEVEPT